MWSNLRLVRAASIVVATAALAGMACGGPTGTFYVVQNQVAGPGCTIPGSAGALYLGQGTLDVRASAGTGSGYLLFPLLKNDLPAEGNGNAEPNRIALDGFDIDVRLVDGPTEAFDVFGTVAADPATAVLLRYREAWSGSVSPGGGTTAAATTVFPAEAARLLREAGALANASARVEVRLRASGRTLSGSLKSDAFTFPLRVCDGCLINSVSACPAKAPILQGGVCNPGQDELVDCCTAGADLICPAPGAP
jgi:hypothetical protein